MKTTVKSNTVYSPQAFLEDLFGEAYYFNHKTTYREQVDEIMREHGQNPVTYYLTDTEKAVKSGKPIVLVNCCDFSSDGDYICDYLWYEVPENFCEGK